ncbi:MAG: hypothetical protein M3384_20105 [Acidobacteriota bacterium]|nr:hypothetical protein [Acidobacteriota bacterium]
MEESLSIKWSKLRLSRPIKCFILLATGCVVALGIGFQQNKPVAGQEKKNEQAVQQQQQQRVPDDLADNLFLPSFVHECLDKNKELDKEIDIPSVLIHNPYFVRGDFDGDKSIDYAVIVESRKENREGLLICFRNKETKAVLLGLDQQNPPPFWLLMNWDVETIEDVSKITDANGKLVGIKPKGESVVMKGEDWSGIIYWDGNTFRWKKVILDDAGD